MALLPAQTAGTSTLTGELGPSEADFDAAFGSDFEENGQKLGFSRQPTFIESIEITGNEKTEPATIFSRLLVFVGDLVDDDVLEQSRLRLLGTGYFKSVEFRLRRGSKRGNVILVIDLVERNTIIIDALYLGFSNVSPLYGGLGVQESNFLGRGVSTGAGFVVGKDRRAFDGRIFVPDLSNTPLQLSASGVFVQGREILSPEDPSRRELAYQRAGGTLGIGLGLGAAQRVSLDYRLESILVDRLPNLDPAIIRRAPSIQFDESILSTLTLTYERDTRDDPFVPSAGSRIAGAVEIGTSLLGSSYEFSKYTAEFQLAFEPVSTHALSLRLFGGLVQGYTPFFNQFFLSDFAYFALGRDSLPRAIQVNFSESNDYDDLVISAGADYSIPIQESGNWLYRTYIYGGIDVSATASLDELQEDVGGRGIGERIPLSFDLGIRLDTLIGNFTISTSYILDLVL